MQRMDPIANPIEVRLCGTNARSVVIRSAPISIV
jgi:hypothetical protein